MDGSIQQAQDLLGVAADSDPATLAHAYRRLALANHPDVSAAPDAAHRFATITAAYHLLRDRPEVPRPGNSPTRQEFIAGRGVATLRSTAMGGPQWWVGSVAGSPIVAGPVTVDPARPTTVGDPTQEAR